MRGGVSPRWLECESVCRGSWGASRSLGVRMPVWGGCLRRSLQSQDHLTPHQPLACKGLPPRLRTGAPTHAPPRPLRPTLRRLQSPHFPSAPRPPHSLPSPPSPSPCFPSLPLPTALFPRSPLPRAVPRHATPRRAPCVGGRRPGSGRARRLPGAVRVSVRPSGRGLGGAGGGMARPA